LSAAVSFVCEKPRFANDNSKKPIDSRYFFITVGGVVLMGKYTKKRTKNPPPTIEINYKSR
jgi:hypothetical protein